MIYVASLFFLFIWLLQGDQTSQFVKNNANLYLLSFKKINYLISLCPLLHSCFCFSHITALPLQLLILTPSVYPTSAQNMLWQLNRVSFFITNRLLPKSSKHFAKWLFFVEDMVFNINYNSVQYCNTQVAIVGKNTVFWMWQCLSQTFVFDGHFPLLLSS